MTPEEVARSRRIEAWAGYWRSRYEDAVKPDPWRHAFLSFVAGWAAGSIAIRMSLAGSRNEAAVGAAALFLAAAAWLAERLRPRP